MKRCLKSFGPWMVLFFFGFGVLLACQSTSPKRVPANDIRSRADRAFGDLNDAETGRSGRQPRAAESGEVETDQGSAPIPKTPLTTGEQPDWVAGSSARYPSDRFLSAVGYGKERAAAEDKARAELAKIFYTEIDASNRTIQSIMESTAGSRTDSRETVDFQEVINISTNKILSGVRIAEVYDPGRDGSHIYALAVLDRHQTQTILQSKIEGLDRDVRQLLAASDRQADKLLRIKTLQACVQKHVLRQAYDAELRIVDPDGKGITAPIAFTEINQRLVDTLLKDFFIAVSVEGARADDVRRALTEALNQNGFTVSGDLSKAVVLARGTIEINPIDHNVAGWKFVRWNAYFDLVDRHGDAVFGSVQRSGKEGHLTLSQAEERAVMKIRKTLAVDISEDLKKFIFSQGNSTY